LDLQPHNRDLADDNAFRLAFMGPYAALWARNLPVHVLAARGHGDLSAYKMVIVPAINLMSQASAERLTQYVENGGTLIVTPRTGFLDESGQVPGPAPGHLASILGTTVEEIDSQPTSYENQVRFTEGPAAKVPVRSWFEVLQPAASQPLAVYESGYYAGRPAATIRTLDPGRAIYAGVLAGTDFYGALFDWLLPLLSIEPLLDTPPGVEASARTGPAGQVLFLLNHNAAPATVTIRESYVDAVGGGRVTQRLELEPRSVRILHRRIA
jgi:beta-galactosidase